MKFRTQLRRFFKKGHDDNGKLKITITGRSAFWNITAIFLQLKHVTWLGNKKNNGYFHKDNVET